MEQIIYGITGGIGSGKSYIAKGLAERGFLHYDCDLRAKQLIETSPTLREQLIDLLGAEAYLGDRYNTAYVASRVFSHPDLLERLNAIVHPAVLADICKLRSESSSLNASILLESAILFSSPLAALCTKTIAVVADEDIRLSRAIERDHSDIDKVRARMRAQMSDEELARRADIVVINNGQLTLSELCQSILQRL